MEEKSDHRIFSYYIAYYSIHRSKKSFLEGNKTILLGNRQMEWIEYSRLSTINTVDDFDVLLIIISCVASSASSLDDRCHRQYFNIFG